MNSKGFATTLVIVLVVIAASIVGLVTLSTQNVVLAPSPTVLPSREATIPPSATLPSSTTKPTTPATPKPTPSLKPTTTVSASLNQQFTLKKGQTAAITGTGLEIEITRFFNEPCPKGRQCFWSGVGLEITYRLNGKTETGLNLTKAFGYQTTIVQTDHETYATLIVKK